MPKRRQNSANPRKLKFALEFLKCGVAETAALAAGYSRSHARAHAYQMADEVNISLAKVARAKGVAEHQVIDKYIALMEAKRRTPWGFVDDNQTQLDATDRIAKIIEPEIPPPPVQFFGINFESPDSKEQFIERQRLGSGRGSTLEAATRSSD